MCLFAVLLVGCATTPGKGPKVGADKADAGAQAVVAGAPADNEELLARAALALQSANEAHRAGDKDEARTRYNEMLRLLLEAEPDPDVFYELTDELELIIEATARGIDDIGPRIPSRIPDEFITEARPGDIYVPNPLPARAEKQLQDIENLKLYRKGFLAGLNRSHKYQPYIKAELSNAGMPEELMWLPLVESLYTPRITSHAGAGGMWQFMRGTGRRYGLRIDSYVDERYHWQKSTRAAIAYLSDLYEVFDGNWPLAVSAYNMGEYGLERAVARNGGERDLWALVDTPPASYHIPRETKNFYPKLLAYMIVGSNPDRYGFKVEAQQPDDIVWVAVNGSWSLQALDKECGLSSGTLARLNPNLIRGVTPAHGGEYDVALPPEAEQAFREALKKLPQVKGTIKHVVKRGETLSGIAQKYRVSLREIMQVNNLSKRSANRLQIGKKLEVPINGVPTASGRVESVGGRRVYTVARGDALSVIAQRQGVSVARLQQWNNLGKSTTIRVGEKLYVSAPGSGPTLARSGEKGTHTVRAGENPAKIARNYGVDLEAFLRWNNLSRSSVIYVGQKVVVYKPGNGGGQVVAKAPSGAQPGGTTKREHTVAKNESPWVIARRYKVPLDDFLAWNGLTRRSTVHVGDKCIVYVPAANNASATKKSAQASDDGRRIQHTVTRGQNPTTIARRYKVDMADLYRWNGWDRDPVLKIGSKITLYVAE
jgi:peptidoglycan lytic transglycosylase D